MEQPPNSAAPVSGLSDLNVRLEPGDYVLATKYRDGDPGDQWAVGFFTGMLQKAGGDRYMVADADGNQFRANGFRRVKKISAERGRFLLEQKQEIKIGVRSVWWWARTRMTSNGQDQQRSDQP